MPKKTFVQAMQELEKIVEELEAGDLPLEKAMNKFEEGIQLTRFCTNRLDETEKKINILLQDQQGDIVKQSFEPEKNTDE